MKKGKYKIVELYITTRNPSMSTHDAQARTETRDYISSHPFEVPCQAQYGIARARPSLYGDLLLPMSICQRPGDPLAHQCSYVPIWRSSAKGEGSHSAQMSLSCLDNTGCNIRAVTIHQPSSCPASTVVLRRSILFPILFFSVFLLFSLRIKNSLIFDRFINTKRVNFITKQGDVTFNIRLFEETMCTDVCACADY